MSEPLASWSDGQAKTKLLEFVQSVTEPGAAFVPESERVAAFDNDGTLWCEKPLYPQAHFLLRRWKEMAQAHPGRAKKQPWKAVIENDQKWLAGNLADASRLTRGVSEAYAGITVKAFERSVGRFFDTARHPVLGVPYTRLSYRPMQELIDLLDDNGFQVHICSGGGRDFVRAVVQEMYGIPRERVIGSGATLEYRHGKLYRSTQSMTDQAGRSTSGLAPGASRCWPRETLTGTRRCWRRPGSAC